MSDQDSDIFTQENRNTAIRILNPLTFFATLILSIFLNPHTNHKGESSILIYPSSYALYIMIVIFSLEGIFSLYSAAPTSQSLKRNDDLIYRKIGFSYSLNWIFLGLWIVSLYYDNVYTKPIQIILIISTLLSQFYIHSNVSAPFKHRKLNLIETVTLRFGGSLYLGWIFILASINISLLFNSFYFQDHNSNTWLNDRSLTLTEVFLLAVAFIWMTFRFRDPVIGLVLIWTLISIFLKNPTNGALDYFLWAIIALQSISSVSLLIHQIIVTLKPYNDQPKNYLED